MQGDWLLIFVKAPSPGEVKTRLLPILSAEDACQLYRCLVLDTLNAARALRGVHVVLAYAATSQFPDCSWLGEEVPIVLQQGDDLGARLVHAFRWAFARKARHVVVVGSDAPDISTHWLRLAFQELSRVDVVVGPSTDGGYHLIGLNHPHPKLLTDMPWSTDRLLAQTLQRIRRLGLTVRCLEPISDLDTPKDVQRYLATLDGRRRLQTHTARYLTRDSTAVRGDARTVASSSG